MPDRWRVWELWQQHGFDEHVQRFRRMPWVHRILQCIMCPPLPFNLFPLRPASSSRSRSRSPVRDRSGFYPQRPAVRLAPAPEPATVAPVPSLRPSKASAPEPAKRIETWLLLPRIVAPVPSPRPSKASAEAPSRSRSRSRPQPQPKRRPLPLSQARGSVAPVSSAAGPLQAPPPSVPRPTSTSSAGDPAAANRQSIPWPCRTCRAMPWKCSCQRQGAQEDISRLAGVWEQAEEDQATAGAFEDISRRAGVWEQAEADQATADTRAQRAESPEPDRDDAMWTCPRCKTMNTVHNLHCRVASCVQRRPLVQQFRIDLGDWFCQECNNHNMGHRQECNWSACPTRDWRCECGNLNRSNRKFCNRRDPPCGLPRPHSFF